MRTLPAALTLPALILALLPACQPDAPSPADPAAEPQPTAEAQAQATATAPATDVIPAAADNPLRNPDVLAGEYRVAGIDGEDVNEPYAITLTIDEQQINLSECAGLQWSYTYADGQIETERRQRPTPGMLCRPTPRVAEAGTAIDAARQVERTPSNGIQISGGGRSVLLFSQ